MYVCICNAIRENQLRAAAHGVAGGAEQVYAALGRKPKCRQCLEQAGKIIFEERRRPRQAA